MFRAKVHGQFLSDEEPLLETLELYASHFGSTQPLYVLYEFQHCLRITLFSLSLHIIIICFWLAMFCHAINFSSKCPQDDQEWLCRSCAPPSRVCRTR